uniref:Fe2OG dioxygenase domain-containing protein n=1 Tax=Macrostomum lignano TaxID=282301 RepID=A0A1I8HIG4_9PLAT
KWCSRDTDSPPSVSTKIRAANNALTLKRATAGDSASNWYLKRIEILKVEGETTIIRLPKPDKTDSKAYNLPNNCNISYHPSALKNCDSQILKILTDEIQAKAFHHHTNGRPEARKIVWFGPEYSYDGTKISANDNWHPLVISLATWLSVEFQLPVFNSCLINFYKDGSINIPWHSDDEAELGPNPTIASISFGAARDFHMRAKGSTNIAWSQRLASGSLLVMSGATQSHLQHAVLKDPKVKELRVNLTFRLTHDARFPEELPVSAQSNPCVKPIENSITCDLDDEDSSWKQSSNRAAAAAAAAAASAASDTPPAEAPASRPALTNPAAIQISANPPTLPAVASDSVAAPNLGVENANDTRKSSERGLISRMGVLEVVLQALTRLMGTNPGQMLTEWEAGQLAIQAVTEVLAALRNRRGPDSGTGDTEAAQAGGGET